MFSAIGDIPVENISVSEDIPTRNIQPTPHIIEYRIPLSHN
jgi:hypothetical protein